MKGVLMAFVVLSLQTALFACLQDRDTLADEARGLPDVVQVITGRFPRNPPLFYQMRLQRVAAELKKNPHQLDLYDDAGVACDRIGQDDEAIQWMHQKLPYLQQANAEDKAVQEHWYRYYANLGTFLAHRWLRAGANRANISQMEQARDYIKQAIKIKPDAHFGREKYQLKAMEWIISPPKDVDYDGRLNDFLGLAEHLSYEGGQDELKKLGYEDATKGLSGLITLGNAWESVDIFYELKLVLMMQNKATLVSLSNFRLQELIKQGKHSLHPTAPTGEKLKNWIAPLSYEPMGWYPASDKPDQLEKFYHYARAEAEAYQKQRTEYMVQRLKAGRHPDTDTSFWNDWYDSGPPDPGITHSWWFNNPWAVPLAQSLGAITLISLLLLWTLRKKRHTPHIA
ncbi:MAG: hypothetical protein JO316_16520 [Abitibacteriaceae bacterium]|nr:hypothetical protein [Abditibacteriaceae bacterium]MBV9866958.1 hypothetical protein [Abditibacteriaceae bacterium]